MRQTSAWTCAVIVICGVSTACTWWARQDDDLLARDIQVSDTTFTPIVLSKSLRVWRPTNQLWLQVPSLADANGMLVLKNGVRLQFDIVAETREGTRVPLDDVRILQDSDGRFLVATAAQFRGQTGGQPTMEITKLWLKSQPAVQVARVIWLAYDPRDFKSGVTSPSESMRP
jgi:hypothetical protein